MAMRNAKGAPAVGHRARPRKMNFAIYVKSHKPCELRKMEFRNLWQISQALHNKALKNQAKSNFHIPCEISQGMRNPPV